MKIPSLAFKSLKSRFLSSCLTILLIGFSVALVLTVERTREGAKDSFQSTVSGVDLIVGAKGGPLQLLLYSVFRMGSATNNLSWTSYLEWSSREDIAFSIPLSLGDSYRGFRVLGTNETYFKHFRYRNKQSLKWHSGRPFKGLFEAVIGSQVATLLDHRVGDELIISHGISQETIEGSAHENTPFKIVGVLKKTGTPVDQTVHINLASMEAIHLDWQDGLAPRQGEETAFEDYFKMKLTPDHITAVLIGLKSKLGIFRLQREINDYKKEPLMAILPGVEFQNLWSTVSAAESALLFISFCVILVALLSMVMNLFMSVQARRKEMAVLRSVGAHPKDIFSLIVGEAAFLSFVGILLGLTLFYLTAFILESWVLSEFGILIPASLLKTNEILILMAVFLVSLVISFLPAYLGYRQSLSDGLEMRL